MVAVIKHVRYDLFQRTHVRFLGHELLLQIRILICDKKCGDFHVVFPITSICVFEMLLIVTIPQAPL